MNSDHFELTLPTVGAPTSSTARSTHIDTSHNAPFLPGSAMNELSKPYLLPKENPFHIPPHVAMSRMDDELKECMNQVKELQRRNYYKDTGKKFEGSWTRVSVIMVITYCTLCTYMFLIGVSNPFLNAIVPTVGFNLSTWSLPQVKKVWMTLHDWNYGRGREELQNLGIGGIGGVGIGNSARSGSTGGVGVMQPTTAITNTTTAASIADVTTAAASVLQQTITNSGSNKHCSTNATAADTAATTTKSQQENQSSLSHQIVADIV